MRTVFFPKQAEEDMEALCLATKAQMLKVVNEANWMMKCRPRKDVRAFSLPSHNFQLESDTFSYSMTADDGRWIIAHHTFQSPPFSFRPSTLSRSARARRVEPTSSPCSCPSSTRSRSFRVWPSPSRFTSWRAACLMGSYNHRFHGDAQQLISCCSPLLRSTQPAHLQIPK